MKANDFNYLINLSFGKLLLLFYIYSATSVRFYCLVFLWLSLAKDSFYWFPNDVFVSLSRIFLLKTTGF